MIDPGVFKMPVMLKGKPNGKMADTRIEWFLHARIA